MFNDKSVKSKASHKRLVENHRYAKRQVAALTEQLVIALEEIAVLKSEKQYLMKIIIGPDVKTAKMIRDLLCK